MSAQPSAPVYRGYGQAELDAQYDQATLVADFAPYFDHWRTASARARAELDCQLDVAYGPDPAERLDIFPAGAGAPVAVLIHGGAWRRPMKDLASFAAPGFVAAGVAFVVLGFPVIPAVDLAGMVAAVRAGLAWLHGNARGFGGDPARFHLLGHSSGAHLAGMILADMVLADDVVKSALLASGAYDLEPCRLSARNAYLKLDAAAARRLSPPYHVPAAGPPVTFAWGGGELAEFRRQSRAYAAAWRAAGHRARELELAGLNHFDIFTAFGERGGPLLDAALSQITRSQV